ncbi:histidine phosphatase family protein [Clostridium sp.]|uniref:histidine phosphatase family protein n=1 Tax=Clostridium sp. TaxID=1506 RepID=UPI003D6CB97E
MNIYITRHGETEWNKQGRMQGWKNSNLTKKGVDNAIKLGKSLKHIEFDYIYCSPLGRAIDTANYIRGDKTTEITIIEDLKEMGFGVYEGMENEKIKELYTQQQYNFWNKPHLYETIDGERFEELIQRVKQVLKHIIINTTCENILIVTHTLVIKALYLIIKNRSLEDFWKPPFMYDTCLTVLEVQGTKIEIIIEADISHLD